MQYFLEIFIHIKSQLGQLDGFLKELAPKLFAFLAAVDHRFLVSLGQKGGQFFASEALGLVGYFGHPGAEVAVQLF